jgi:hypothetical protein
MELAGDSPLHASVPLGKGCMSDAKGFFGDRIQLLWFEGHGFPADLTSVLHILLRFFLSYQMATFLYTHPMGFASGILSTVIYITESVSVLAAASSGERARQRKTWMWLLQIRSLRL